MEYEFYLCALPLLCSRVLASFGHRALTHVWCPGFYIWFHLKAAVHTFFSSARVAFFRIDHMFSHKASLNKGKEIEVISSINSMKLEIDDKKTGKLTSMWRLNNVLLNKQWAKEKNQRRNSKIPETSKNRNTASQNSFVQ